MRVWKKTRKTIHWIFRLLTLNRVSLILFHNSRRTVKTSIQFGTRFNVRLIKSVHLIEGPSTVDRFSFECRKASTMFQNCVKQTRARFHPFRTEPKNNHEWSARVFPRAVSATCHYLFYCIASSVSGQNESNPVLRPAIRAGEMELSRPLETTRRVPQEKFP